MAVLAVHDLSCYSKSSLTVVLPVLEALSVETAVLPTAILSTQTDGFEDIYFEDKSAAMREILKRLRSLGAVFSGIYSGFLGSAEEIGIVGDVIRDFPDALALVDPVLGDNGELYQTVTDEMADAMRRLVRKAEIITPNITEAMILTEMDDGLRKFGQRAISEQVEVLRSLGPSRGVITGIPLEAGGLGNAAWDGREIRLFQYEDLGVSYPGSGDLFASVLFGLVVRGESFFGSAGHATAVATAAVAGSLKSGRERRMGISLSPALSEIRRRML